MAFDGRKVRNPCIASSAFKSTPGIPRDLEMMLRSLVARRLSVDRAVTNSRASLQFSSAATKADGDESLAERGHPQPFVQAKIQPGEWDENRTDPYFRPRPHPRANFISAEDFANRPPVGFDGEFNTYQDAMISLSWMDQRTCKEIYETYTQLMMASQEKHNTTSHEYVVRVIADKYHINTTRAAGIIQLQHAEEQMRQHNPELLCSDVANHAEGLILQNIRDAYKSEQMNPPGQSRGQVNSLPFIEDPVGIHGRGEPDETSTQWANLDDIYDMEQKVTQARIRDAEKAKILIDNHIYKEDVDEEEQLVHVDASSRKLIKAKEKLKADMATTTDASSIPYPETNGNGEKRQRWKYVAQIVNTRSLKKKKAGKRKAVSTSYTNNTMGNTLVEHNGELRVATVAEAKQTAWKPTRTRSNEYIFEGAKKAWLERTIKGKTGVWGHGPRTRASDGAVENKETAKVTDVSANEKGEETSAEVEQQITEDDVVEPAEATEEGVSTQEQDTQQAVAIEDGPTEETKQ